MLNLRMRISYLFVLGSFLVLKTTFCQFSVRGSIYFSTRKIYICQRHSSVFIYKFVSHLKLLPGYTHKRVSVSQKLIFLIRSFIKKIYLNNGLFRFLLYWGPFSYLDLNIMFENMRWRYFLDFRGEFLFFHFFHLTC